MEGEGAWISKYQCGHDVFFAYTDIERGKRRCRRIFKLGSGTYFHLLFDLGRKYSFFTKLEKGIYHRTENDLEAEMYQSIIERMKQKGYEHYEISNFAKKGYISRHNQKYWKNQKYLGLGLGASGYLGKLRYTNCSDFETYFFSWRTIDFPERKRKC